jgi:lysophospholipase L1-like esterase
MRTLAALGLLLGCSIAHATDLYGALGDSITAGHRAETQLGGKGADQLLEDVGLKAKTLWFRDKKANMYSWASGPKVLSQFVLLNRFLRSNGEHPVEVVNAAENGKRVADLPKQIEKFAQAIRTQKYERLAYVTMLIGANDVCYDTPNDQFRASLENAFSQLAQIKQDRPIRMFVMSIPNIADLGREEINKAVISAGITCGAFRNRLNACRNVLKWETQEEYEQRREVVRKKNDILREVATKAYSNLDVRYSNALFESRIEVTDLAIDCFHPNRTGQEKLSKLAWQAQPWFLER